MKISTKEHLLRWFKILKRTFLLFLFGVILNISNSKFIFWKPFRIPGVLQRISICFFVITSIHILIENIYLQCLSISLMQFVYLFGMFMIDVPNYKNKICGKGIITAECSGSGYIDRLIFSSGFLYQWSPTDPEGILSTLSAFTTTYFGLLYFHISKKFKNDSYKKLTYWLSLGVVLIVIGSIIDSNWFPFNKNIYSTSFALFTSGLCGIFLSIFSIIMDEFQFHYFLIIFVWIGRNPFIMYFLPAMVNSLFFQIRYNKQTLKHLIYNYSFGRFGGVGGSFLYSSAFLGIWVILSFIMDYKKIYIKL